LSQQELNSTSSRDDQTPAIVVYGKEEKESALYIAGNLPTAASNKLRNYIRVNPLGVDGKLIEAGSSEKSVVNTKGVAKFIRTENIARIDTNAGEVITTANQQDIICG